MGWATYVMNAAAHIGNVHAEQEEYKRKEELHKYNARVAEQDAKDAEMDGRDLANRQRGENARLQAKQRSLYGASGVVATTGTPLAVQAQTAGQLEMAALDNEIAGQRVASKLRMEKQLHLLEARAVKRARRMALIAGIMDGGRATMTGSSGGGGGGGMNFGSMFGGGGGGAAGGAAAGGGGGGGG